MISYDHATIHADAAFAKVFAGGRVKRAPLAPRMPDGNKVVEHVFPDLKAKFFTRLVAKGGRFVDAKAAQNLLFNTFEEQITIKQIQEDTKGLPLTMKMIATDEGQAFLWPQNGKTYYGTGGNWAKRGHR